MNQRNEHLKTALDLLMEAGHHLEAAGFPESAEEADCRHCAFLDLCSSDENSDESCVTISYDSFTRLMGDLVTLADMVDALMERHEQKEHLVKTLLGIAAKLDTTAEEKRSNDQILKSANSILDYWSNVLLTAQIQ